MSMQRLGVDEHPTLWATLPDAVAIPAPADDSPRWSIVVTINTAIPGTEQQLTIRFLRFVVTWTQ
jgi:hypothetical protein